MFERFTDRARHVLVLAQEEARLLNHGFIGTEHILLGLIREGKGVAGRALANLNIDLDDVRAKVEEAIGLSGTAATGSPPFTPRAKNVLELSLREALQLGHHDIGTEHLLLGLVREGEGVGAQILVQLGTDLGRVRQEVIGLLTGPHVEEAAISTAWTSAPSHASMVGSKREGASRFIRHAPGPVTGVQLDHATVHVWLAEVFDTEIVITFFVTFKPGHLSVRKAAERPTSEPPTAGEIEWFEKLVADVTSPRITDDIGTVYLPVGANWNADAKGLHCRATFRPMEGHLTARRLMVHWQGAEAIEIEMYSDDVTEE